MNAKRVGAIETVICLVASATFAGATGFAAFASARDFAPQPQLGIITGVVGVIAFLVSSLAMRGRPARRSTFRPAPFEVAEFEPFETDEPLRSEESQAPADTLVLTDAGRIDRPEDTEEPLILDDVLAELEPDSRVVRLFDRKAMPTPGQLQSRIDHHLGERSQRPASDAAQALSDALAELRRSLR